MSPVPREVPPPLRAAEEITTKPKPTTATNTAARAKTKSSWANVTASSPLFPPPSPLPQAPPPVARPARDAFGELHRAEGDLCLPVLPPSHDDVAQPAGVVLLWVVGAKVRPARFFANQRGI